jgi:hypothetical protein
MHNKSLQHRAFGVSHTSNKDVYMKFLGKYLIVTSVVFHILLLASLYWVLPYYNYMQDTVKTNMDSHKQENYAVVKNVTEISRNGLKYKGYLVSMDGQDLYVQGTGDDSIAVNEEVKILINVHPYKDLQTLTVIAVKK